MFQEWDSSDYQNKDKVVDVIVKRNSMIRGITYYNETAHSFNVEGDLVKPLHVGTWQITVEIHYDLSLFPLSDSLGVKVHQNSFLLTIEEREPEVDEEAEEDEEVDDSSSISWEPYKPKIPDKKPRQ